MGLLNFKEWSLDYLFLGDVFKMLCVHVFNLIPLTESSNFIFRWFFPTERKFPSVVLISKLLFFKESERTRLYIKRESDEKFKTQQDFQTSNDHMLCFSKHVMLHFNECDLFCICHFLRHIKQAVVGLNTLSFM